MSSVIPSYAEDWLNWLSSDDDWCQGGAKVTITPSTAPVAWLPQAPAVGGENSGSGVANLRVSAGSELKILTLGGGETALPNTRIVENEIEQGMLVAQLQHEVCQLLTLPPECVKVVVEVHSDIASTATVVFMQQTDETYHEADGEVCHVCAHPCEDADDVWVAQTRVGNCNRCQPCYLCPQCNVIDERGNACCFFCLEAADRDHVEARYRDKMFRIRLLGAQMLGEQELPADGRKSSADEHELPTGWGKSSAACPREVAQGDVVENKESGSAQAR